ncbi:MAG: ornithine carbamoyltransferase [bacterium]|nr:ornithine carbamoyltransferase [bacterium]
MAQNLKNRHFLTLLDFTPEEIRLMLDVAHEYKRLKRAGIPHRIHEGKQIALLFEKTSTRTRTAFTVAARDLGIAPEFLGKDDIQLGKKESVADTAIVLGRSFDGIEFRGFEHSTVEELAKHAGVPVWNGLTDLYHPTQILADFMTIEEHLGYLKGAKLVFVGDGRNNMANSLMIGSAKMGVDFRIAAPHDLQPDPALVEKCREIARETGAKFTITDDLYGAARGADFVYTDVWVSMGEEDKYEERIHQLRGFQVNRNLLNATGNPNVKFMHCLPAFHDLNTATMKDIYAKFGLTEMEVTDEVFSSQASVVFDEAENRMHTIKAVIALTL